MNVKSFLAGCLLPSLMLCAAPAALAQDERPSLFESASLGIEVHGMVGFTTENFSRGKSDTKPGTPAVIGQLELEHDSGAYLQLYGANVKKAPPEDTESLEISYVAGFRGDFSDEATYDLSATYTTYPGARRADGLNFNFVEFSAKADYDFGFAKPYVGVSFAPEYQFDSGPAWYIETGAEVPIARYFTGLFHVGHSTFDRNDRVGNHDYSDVSVGIGTTVAALDVKIEYIATDLPKNECVSSCDRVVLTVSKKF